jgi:N-acetylglucosaminyldiphosphoundecaprenol N-acetyl-beta-D-mannosaminyltransferase
LVPVAGTKISWPPNKCRTLLQFNGIRIYEASLQRAIPSIVEQLYAEINIVDQTHCISATGAHGLVEAYKDVAFKNILQQFYWNLPDGMPLVWWGRLKGYTHMDRCYGPDFFAGIMQATSSMEVAHFFCGGKPGVVEELKMAVELKWGNNNVADIYSPPFSPMQDADWELLVSKINESKSQVVWVGLSTPKQEKFAFELSKRVKVKFIITVGAAFDFHTGRLTQAPYWMQRAGLEWFFRLLIEPRRLWKRYIEIVPKFAILAGTDLIKHYLQKRT